MSDYPDLDLNTHVLLSADVFEKFIGVYLEYYRLDPCHCFRSPELNWDVMLNIQKTIVELELISEIDMYQFVLNGMRGGISYIAKR